MLPRLLLAALDQARVRRLRRRLSVDWEADPWALRILAAERGRGVRVDLVSYSYHLAPRALEGLQALLLDLLGNRTSLEPERALEYGAPAPAVEARAEESGRCVVLVFSLAQTPEQEVHGDFLEELKERVRGAGALLVVVDEGPFRARLGDDEDARRRLDERRATWARLLREVRLGALFATLDGAAEPRRLEEARAAMWPEALKEAV